MPNLVLVSGDEEYLVERCALEEAQMSLPREVLQFYGKSGVEEYLAESGVPLLDEGRRSFILWDVNEIPALPNGTHDTLVVVSGKKPIAHSSAKRTLKFPKLKNYSDNNEVLGWILKEGERRNIDLSRVAGALFVNSGSCLRKLASEIEKLALARESNQSNVVSPDVARSLLCFSADLTPGHVVDAVCEGNTSKALAFYDKLQERADETGWIIAYMQRHVLQQLRLELLSERKVSDDRAAITLGVHPFIYKRMRSTRLGLWTKRSLLSGIDTFSDLDILHKRGSPSAKLGLELEIVRLSEESKDGKR